MLLHRNILANYAGRAYSIGAVYLFVPFYISILGMEAYGLIGFSLVILTLAALADVGLSTTFARQAARESDRGRLLDLLTTMERVLALSASLLAALVFFSADLIATKWLNTSADLGAEETATSIRLMSVMLAPQLMVSLYTAGLFGLQRQGLANGVQALYTTVRSGLVILPIYLWPQVSTFFSWQFASSLVFLVVARTILLRQMGCSPWDAGRYAMDILQPQLKFAGGMLTISIIASINTQLDKLVVSKFFSVTELGYYTLASTLAQLPLAAASPVMVALFPRFTALNEQGNHSQVSALYENYSFLIALISAVGTFGLMFFTRDVLTLWLGHNHVPQEVVDITRLLACGGLFLALASTPFYLGLASGHNRTSILLGIMTLTMTVPLLFVASRHFGLVGAAIPWLLLNATTFFVLAQVINGSFYRGTSHDWFLRSTALPVAIGAIGMFAAHRLSEAVSLGSLASSLIALVAAAAILTGGVLFMRTRLSLS